MQKINITVDGIVYTLHVCPVKKGNTVTSFQMVGFETENKDCHGQTFMKEIQQSTRTKHDLLQYLP